MLQSSSIRCMGYRNLSFIPGITALGLNFSLYQHSNMSFTIQGVDYLES